MTARCDLGMLLSSGIDLGALSSVLTAGRSADGLCRWPLQGCSRTASSASGRSRPSSRRRPP
eukprot:1371832-Pleurochrysis_carterae.AAC.2